MYTESVRGNRVKEYEWTGIHDTRQRFVADPQGTYEDASLTLYRFQGELRVSNIWN